MFHAVSKLPPGARKKQKKRGKKKSGNGQGNTKGAVFRGISVAMGCLLPHCCFTRGITPKSRVQIIVFVVEHHPSFPFLDAIGICEPNLSQLGFDDFFQLLNTPRALPHAPGSPPAPADIYSKQGDRRESSYCDTDSSLSSELGGGGGGRGSSRSSFGSSVSESPGGSESSFHGQDPMQYSDDEDEGKEGYKVGGYHAVKVRNSCSFAIFSGVVQKSKYVSFSNEAYPVRRWTRWFCGYSWKTSSIYVGGSNLSFVKFA